MKYKLSYVLAGMAGSLLFWIWSISMPWTIEEVLASRKKVDATFMSWARMGAMGVMAILLYVLSLHEIFNETDAVLLSQFPNGKGLNPLLQTDLMAIHPPVVFLAYGFLAITFAAAIAGLITGKKDWLRLSMNWSRAGWLFLTLGIGLGGLWAYTVLGWGGYWAWDPVETSSFLPWILLTGFLHAQLMSERKGDYKLMAPLMGYFTFLLVIFATFATRAGGLWVSVHTFGQADTQIPPLERLETILKGSETVLVYMVFMVVGIALAFILGAYRYIKSEQRKDERYYTLSELINDDVLMLLTLMVSMIATVVTFIILVNGVNGLNADDFDGKVGFVTLIAVLVMVFCLVWRNLGRKWMSIVGAVTMAASLAGFVAFPDHRLLGASAPLLCLALVTGVYRVAASINHRRPWASVKLASAHMVHLAVALILIGYVASSYLVEEEDVVLTVDGAGVQVAGYTIRAVDAEFTSDSVFVEVEIWEGSDFIAKERPGLVLIDGQVRNEIQVASMIHEDIYLIYQSAEMDGTGIQVHMTVKVLPLMNFVWAGMYIMALAIVARMVSDWVQRHASISKGREPPKKARADDSYYDEMVEAELARLQRRG